MAGTGSRAQTRWAMAADLVDPPELRWRRDPVAWAKERGGLELWSKQKEILESVRDNPNTAVRSCHSTGKGLWIDTPLPTPTGWLRMGDVCVGDVLYDESGHKTRVTATSPVRHLDCYRITFRGGGSLVCDGDHLWNVLTMSKRRKIRGRGLSDWRDTWDETETVDARALQDLFTQSVRGGRPGVPLARAIDSSHDDSLLIPPYVLGVWLGDGCAWNATISNHPSDSEITEQIEKLGWLVFRSERQPISVRLRPDVNTSMATLLRAYDLVKNKHIPAPYLRASREQRLELLRGLMDADGHASKEMCGSVDVGFKHEVLARQTYELVRSLGFPASFRRSRARLYGKDCGDFFNVSFASDVSPFHLTRKTALWRPAHPRVMMRTVESIESVPSVPTRCITVDSPRGLYLAGESMTVTHNSFISSVATCWWLDVHPPGSARVITTAPTSKQVDAVLWYEINKLHAKLGLRGQCNLREWYFGKQLVAFGKKPPDHQEAAFQGMHALYLLVIYDEAYGIPKTLWDEGTSLASNEYGRQLAIGNPDGPGIFEDKCKPGSTWNVIHISYQHSPNFTGEQVSRELSLNLIAKRWVEERAQEWGRDSALFQSKCEGNFPSGGDPNAVIPYAWAARCKLLELPEDPDDVEAGIDVGAGADRTVIRERRGMRAGRESSFIDKDPMRTIGKLVEKINEWGVTRVKIDVTGIGWALGGRLRELSSRHNPTGETTHSAEVVRVNFGEKASMGNEKKFLNRRAEIYWTVGRELSRLNLWDLSEVDDSVLHELTVSRYEIMDSYGKIKIEPKKQVIDRLRMSPDRAEALLLAFYKTQRQAIGFGRAGQLLREQNSFLRDTSPLDNLATMR